MFATLIGVSGSAAIAPAGVTDLRRGQLESSSTVFGINEASVQLLEDTLVDVLVDTAVIGSQLAGVNNQNAPQMLGPGSYQSHLLHFDPTSSATVSNATFQFDTPILALIFSDRGSARLLTLSDAVFGLSSITYESDYRRRMESNDRFVIDNAYQITVNPARANNTWFDQMRVITWAQPLYDNHLAVPLPSSLWLLLVGAALFRLRPHNTESWL